MRQGNHRLALLVVASVLAAGCGDDKSGSSDQGSTASTPTATTAPASSPAVKSLAKLQLAASDLVRETSFKDKGGSKRAFAEFNELFEASEEAIEAKAPELASNIEEEAKGVGEELGKGDLGGANREAQALLKAVNTAATAVSGKPAGPTKGLVAVLAQMKAAARDIDEEARNKDATGTKRAYTAFSKLFKSSRSQIEAKSEKNTEMIEAALEKVRIALKGKDDRGQVRAASRQLVTAVNAVAAKTK